MVDSGDSARTAGVGGLTRKRNEWGFLLKGFYARSLRMFGV